MTFEISIKKYKIHNLQIEYKEISKYIFNLQMHIESLHTDLFIDTSLKNQYLSKLFAISKNLNSTYNNYIIDECNSEMEEEQMDLDSSSNEEKKCNENISDSDEKLEILEVSNEYNGIMKFIYDSHNKSKLNYLIK